MSRPSPEPVEVVQSRREAALARLVVVSTFTLERPLQVPVVTP